VLNFENIAILSQKSIDIIMLKIFLQQIGYAQFWPEEPG